MVEVAQAAEKNSVFPFVRKLFGALSGPLLWDLPLLMGSSGGPDPNWGWGPGVAFLEGFLRLGEPGQSWGEI